MDDTVRPQTRSTYPATCADSARRPELGQKELAELAEKLLDDDDRAALRNLGVHDMDEAELMARVSKRDTASPRSG